MVLQPDAVCPMLRDRTRIDQDMDKLETFEFVASDAEDISTRVETADKELLMSVIQNPYNVLHNYFPPIASGRGQLRTQNNA